MQYNGGSERIDRSGIFDRDRSDGDIGGMMYYAAAIRMRIFMSCTQLMPTSLFTIEHQDETFSFTNMKEALVGLVKEDEVSGLLFIKIETEEVFFSAEELQEFERHDKYPLLYTFSFAIAEVESQPVDFSSASQLVGETIKFESNGDTILYIRTHLEINQNKILIEQDGEGFILTWTGVTDDINYYDERAKPNRIYIRTPVKLKQYESVDQFYELEYRSKIRE